MASKKVLGRGLGAFFPDYEESEEGVERSSRKGPGTSSTYIDPQNRVNVVLHIPVGNIRPNPHQPRKEFGEESLSQLAQSIKKHGLIQPITVRYLGSKRFELISGERRLRASKLAGLEEIPSYVREVNDEDIVSYALIENIQREDLNPIEIAMGYQRLVEECNYTQAEVAENVGRNRTTITNMLRLLNLPAFIQAALRDKTISMGHARALITIDDPDIQERIFQKAIEKEYSVRQIEEAVRQIGKEKKDVTDSGNKTDENRAFYVELSKKLRQKLSTKVNIKPKKDGGEIRIEYYTDDDLDRLLELFESI